MKSRKEVERGEKNESYLPTPLVLRLAVACLLTQIGGPPMSRIHALSSPDEYSWIFQNISAIWGYLLEIFRSKFDPQFTYNHWCGALWRSWNLMTVQFHCLQSCFVWNNQKLPTHYIPRLCVLWPQIFNQTSDFQSDLRSSISPQVFNQPIIFQIHFALHEQFELKTV